MRSCPRCGTVLSRVIGPVLDRWVCTGCGHEETDAGQLPFPQPSVPDREAAVVRPVGARARGADPRWVTQRELRPWPLTDLARALGIPEGSATETAQLVLALGVNRRTITRYRTMDLTDEQADRWAIRAGLNPTNVWPTWSSGLRGRALVNANRHRCPCGRRYDRVDSSGKRRCSTCWRAQWRAYKAKKSLKPQVTAVLDHAQEAS